MGRCPEAGAEILDYCKAHPDDVVADSEYGEEMTGARIVAMVGDDYEQTTDAVIVAAMRSYGWTW